MEECEPEETSINIILKPIDELREPNEGNSSSDEKTASVSAQTDDLKPKPIEIVADEMEINYTETEDEFDVDELDYDWGSEFLLAPPPTPKQSLYFNIEETTSGDEFAEEYCIPCTPIQGKKVSIDQEEPSVIPLCGEEKVTKKEKVPKKRAVFKDETLKEKPGLKTVILDPEVEKDRAECVSYAGVERFAAHFVDTIIDQSIENIMTSNTYLFSDVEVNPLEEGSTVTTLPEYFEPYQTYLKWPSIREFTRELGRSAIDDYVQEWEYAEEWLYCIDFLMEQSDDCSDYYLYDVKWSIPTKQYPIPQATASVYFTIQLCRVKPAHCTVDVTYQFEASRLVHSPGKIIFQEKWLFDIIDAKIELFKKIKF